MCFKLALQLYRYTFWSVLSKWPETVWQKPSDLSDWWTACVRRRERATEKEKARERQSSVFSCDTGDRSCHWVATGQCEKKSPTYNRSRIRACKYLKHIDRSYCTGIYPSLLIRLQLLSPKMGVYYIKIYTESCTFLLSVCPILTTTDNERNWDHRIFNSSLIVPCHKFEKKFGGWGHSELGQMEDSRGLLSGMIERCVAYLVAVHPQIV